MSVIEGAKKTIKANRPVLLVEIEQRHIKHPISEVFDQITTMGYSGIFFQHKRRFELSEFSHELHQAPFLGDVYGGSYVNNFLFVPIAL